MTAPLATHNIPPLQEVVKCADGTKGTCFVKQLTAEIKGRSNNDWNFEILLVFADVILPTADHFGSLKVIHAWIVLQMDLWNQWHIASLVDSTIMAGRGGGGDMVVPQQHVRSVHCGHKTAYFYIHGSNTQCGGKQAGRERGFLEWMQTTLRQGNCSERSCIKNTRRYRK